MLEQFHRHLSSERVGKVSRVTASTKSSASVINALRDVSGRIRRRNQPPIGFTRGRGHFGDAGTYLTTGHAVEHRAYPTRVPAADTDRL